MLIVAGLFDQEDIYGGPVLCRALARKDSEGKLVHLVLGPSNHGRGRAQGRGIGDRRLARRGPRPCVLGRLTTMLSADIFRGRYRVDPARPEPLAPGRPLATQRVWRAPGGASTIEVPVIAQVSPRP